MIHVTVTMAGSPTTFLLISDASPDHYRTTESRINQGEVFSKQCLTILMSDSHSPIIECQIIRFVGEENFGSMLIRCSLPPSNHQTLLSLFSLDISVVFLMQYGYRSLRNAVDICQFWFKCLRLFHC